MPEKGVLTSSYFAKGQVPYPKQYELKKSEAYNSQNVVKYMATKMRTIIQKMLIIYHPKC